MQMLADRVDFVIGVDCHKDSNTAAIADRLGGLLTHMAAPTNECGYADQLKWACKLAPGRRVWAVEGSGSFGAGVTDYLLQNGEWVVEVDRPKRSARKAGVKSDEVDALRAARDALSSKRLAEPRQRGPLEAIRVLKSSRKQTINVYAEAVVQLKALVVSAPHGLRDKLRDLSAKELLATCSVMRDQPSQSIDWQATTRAMRTTARRALSALADAAELESQLAELVKTQAPAGLLAEKGVGNVVGAELLCAWSHRNRLHSEAAFAKLAGVAPVEASSGQVVRHRLSRSGDRQLNSALRTVVMTRLASDPRTKQYLTRRRAEGKSDREIQRCLKRYVARHLFRVMEAG
ncbi:MAG: transposase [Candidatus Dormiibacterota bacterium]